MTKTLEQPGSKQLFIDTDEASESLKPPLKWAGGKRWLIPYLFPLWKGYSHNRLVEPFCGALAVALSFTPKDALLNDINQHLINFYKWLKKGLVISLEMNNDEKMFYLYRKRFNTLTRENKSDTKEAAELFYYLNRTAYNGLCRFNNDGEFNVPFGRYKKINYVRDFMSYKKKLSKWIFLYDDFENISVKDDDFIYADPPYDVEFTKYAKEDFTWDDQIRLAKWLSKKSCPVIISNQATAEIIKLYKKLGFKLRFLQAPRMINSSGDRTPAREVLALKNL